MLRHMKLSQRGDTLVEVLLATVVISVVIMGAYTLTNRATRINQTAIERTTATNLVRQQLEFMRGMHTYGQGQAAWTELVGNIGTTPPSYTNCQPTPGLTAFSANTALGYSDANTINTYNIANDNNDIYKVWVEAFRPNSSLQYVDLHVRACWQGIGNTGDLGTQRAASVLRLSL